MAHFAAADEANQLASLLGLSGFEGIPFEAMMALFQSDILWPPPGAVGCFLPLWTLAGL